MSFDLGIARDYIVAIVELWSCSGALAAVDS